MHSYIMHTTRAYLLGSQRLATIVRPHTIRHLYISSNFRVNVMKVAFETLTVVYQLNKRAQKEEYSGR